MNPLKLSTNFGGPEDTILAKLEWYRPGGEVSERQWREVHGILKTRAGELDLGYMRKWANDLLRYNMDNQKNDGEIEEKPITFIVRGGGPFCNLACKYCFFHSIDQLQSRKMPEAVLAKFTREYLENYTQNTFVWHGGEPLLAGIPFYKMAIELQSRFATPRNRIANYLQTNLTLVDEEWATFFKDNKFRVGVSIDGPKNIHDMQRPNVGGRGSFEAAMGGFRIMVAAGLTPGVIAVITKQSLPFLKNILDFFYHELSVKHVAFNAMAHDGTTESAYMQLSADEHIHLLTTCFEYWLEKDDPEFSIRDIDDYIARTLKTPSTTCAFSGKCHQFVSIDDDGNLNPCERLTGDSGWMFGNIMKQSLPEIMKGEYRQYFELQQTNNLPSDCRTCEYLDGCHNGCTHLREDLLPTHMQGKYVYCDSRKLIFGYVRETFAKLLPDALVFPASLADSYIPIL